jgi:dienelactone hydrolase
MPEDLGYRDILIGPGAHVRARLWDAPARAGVVMVGGVGGGFDTPAQGLYPRLGRHLSGDRVAALQVAFRLPGELGEAALDAAAGVRFLATERGCARVALVGHSFGGAVVIRAATVLPEVAAVVTLATQSYGTERVRDLAGRPILLVHGVDDEILPADCSVQVFGRTGEPKELRLIPGASHGLDEAADEVYRIVHGFLAQHLLDQPAAQRV